MSDIGDCGTSAMLRELVLEVGAEGGSLSLVRRRNIDANWEYRTETDETAFYDLLSKGDLSGLEVSTHSRYVRSFEEALTVLDKYPWFDFVPLKVHPEYFHAVLGEVRKRGGEATERRWRKELDCGSQMLDLRRLVQDLIRKRLHCDSFETLADMEVIDAVNDPARPLEDRKQSLIKWLNGYSVLMGLSTASRSKIAGEIIAFADERPYSSLQLNKEKIVAEFRRLAAGSAASRNAS
jgi:hypothetical protein